MNPTPIPTDGNDFLSAAFIDDPHPRFAWLREHAPVFEVPGTGVHLVTTWDLIVDVLDRQDDFSANLTGVLMRGADGAPSVFDLSVFGGRVDAIANADEPSHAIHRRMVLPHVTPKGVEALEQEIRGWAIEGILPLIEAGGGSWVDQVANPLPAKAMARVVGLPVEDADRLLHWAMTGTRILAGTGTLQDLATIGAETGEMAAYLRERLQLALAEPEGVQAPAIVGELARGVLGGVVSEDDAVSILVVLAGAGGESTSSLIGSAVRILAEKPELQAELRANPERIPAFTEEVVRLEPSFKGHYRVVKRDTELGGTLLREGERVFLVWASANRDPKVFDDPDTLDLDRANTAVHLGFGRGIHYCVGARLARLEARVVLEELLARTEHFALDPERPPAYAPSIFVRRHDRQDLVIDGRSFEGGSPG
jgi:cytochrome P450